VLINPESLLVLTCGLQFLQLPGMFIGQRVLGWQEELGRLTTVSRRLIIALGMGITAYVCGTGAIGLFYPHALATSELGRALCVLQAVAWTIRALFQLLAIGPAWPLRTRWLHRSLATTYSALAVGYSVICWLLLVPTSV
jgi:hypothetical protein